MGKSFLEKAIPIAALGATGFGLAGMGPLAGLAGTGNGLAAGAAGMGGLGTGIGADAMTGAMGAGLLEAGSPAAMSAMEAGMLSSGAPTWLSAAGAELPMSGAGVNLANTAGQTAFNSGLATNGAPSMINGLGQMNMGERFGQLLGGDQSKLLGQGMRMMGGGQQPQQGPQNVFSNVQAAPRQTNQSGSFQDSNNITPQQMEEMKKRQWLMGLGRAQ